MTEFAPGIPDKETSHELRAVEKPERWEYVLHEHDALRRGKHYDLRLGDPKTGHGHSWALAPEWPKPGASTWAIQQPTHTIPYFDFKGRLPAGYGEGTVDIKDRAPIEVINSEPGHVTFGVYRGSGPEEYTLHRIPGSKNWKLYNRTLNRAKHPNLPQDKPAYKEIDTAKVPFDNDSQVMSAKIDGAHNLVFFPPDQRVRMLSYRPSERDTGVIEHTHKVPGLLTLKTPAGLGGTILRGEVFAIGPDGKAVQSKDLGGIMNSNVWKSREKQGLLGKLKIALLDVVRHRGKPAEHLSYDDKLAILKDVMAKAPGQFVLPKMANTEAEKRKLFEDIREGRVPETKEGIVLWDRRSGSPPIKAKFRRDHDVYVRAFFPGEGKYRNKGVGGFIYSHTPDGPLVGRVGTGLSDAQRADMYLTPGKYTGAVAKVLATDVYPLAGGEGPGALRAPAFSEWHLDKNKPEQLEKLSWLSPLARLLADE